MTLAEAGLAGGPGHEFFDRARQRLTLEVPPALSDPSALARRGDLDLDPAVWERAGVVASRPAAVLIPVVDHPVPSVILTLRTPDLTSHAGQIAFPGGKIDPHDESPLAAASGEAEEESALRRHLSNCRLSRPLSDLRPASASCRRWRAWSRATF